MRTVYLSLGSNLGDRRKNLQTALIELGRRGLQVAQISSLYETEPVEVTDQPEFLNLVCEVETELDPESLLEVCRKIETEMGRVRAVQKGPRNIDIDILFYGQKILKLPHLGIPHPRFSFRNFVLIPLEEIAPDFQDPETGKTVGELRQECPDRSRVKKV